MDNLNAVYDDGQNEGYADYLDEGVETPIYDFGTNERRMQVKAYNYWSNLLGERIYPSLADMEPEKVELFGQWSVLLDFSEGFDNPQLAFIGEKLAEEVGCSDHISDISDVPADSLLSRITNQYPEILEAQTPVGFEAEFVNNRNVTILYRCILLPFSSDNSTIDYVYGVINWKEELQGQEAEKIAGDLEKALEDHAKIDNKAQNIPIWEDDPVNMDHDMRDELPEQFTKNLDLATPAPKRPAIALVNQAVDQAVKQDLEVGIGHNAPPISAANQEDSLSALLDNARLFAGEAQNLEARSNVALYQALGFAHDLALRSHEEPEVYDEILAQNDIVVQQRAPMTAVAKLVFGKDYCKSRLAEYAIVLKFAHEKSMESGSLVEFLENYQGGIKALVTDYRQAKNGKTSKAAAQNFEEILGQLRQRDDQPMDSFADLDKEFVILVARRDEDGHLSVIGKMDDDEKLEQKILRNLSK